MRKERINSLSLLKLLLETNSYFTEFETYKHKNNETFIVLLCYKYSFDSLSVIVKHT